MIKLNESLADLGQKLENKKLYKSAKIVDNINSNVLKFIQAQYVGVTGYHIKNDRCFQNCYRQKRATTKDPAQIVWFKCLSEWQQSLNKDVSDWDKYADNLPNLFKSASIDQRIRAYAEEYIFKQDLEKKLSDPDCNIGRAVFETIEENKNRFSDAISSEIKKLASISAYLSKNGHQDLAKYAATITDDMAKLAQFNNKWNPLNWAQNAQSLVTRMQGNASSEYIGKLLQQALTSIETTRRNFPPDLSQLPPQNQAAVTKQMQTLQQQIGGAITSLGQMVRNNPVAGSIYQQLITPFGQFANTNIQDMKSRRIQLDRLANAISNAAQLTRTTQDTQTNRQPTAQPKARPQVPAGSKAAPAGTDENTQTQTPGLGNYKPFTPEEAQPSAAQPANAPTEQTTGAQTPTQTPNQNNEDKQMVQFIQQNAEAINEHLRTMRKTLGTEAFPYKLVASAKRNIKIAQGITPEQAAKWLVSKYTQNSDNPKFLESLGLKVAPLRQTNKNMGNLQETANNPNVDPPSAKVEALSPVQPEPQTVQPEVAPPTAAPVAATAPVATTGTNEPPTSMGEEQNTNPADLANKLEETTKDPQVYNLLEAHEATETFLDAMDEIKAGKSLSQAYVDDLTKKLLYIPAKRPVIVKFQDDLEELLNHYKIQQQPAMARSKPKRIVMSSLSDDVKNVLTKIKGL